MDLILLPGNSRENKSWIDRVDYELKPLFTQSAVHYYDHWWQDDKDAVIDLEVELDKLETTVTQLSSNYVVFAKSAGIVLTLYGIFEGVLNPEVCVFVGFPLYWSRKNGFSVDEWLLEYSVPSLFIQQSEDPALSFEELKAYLLERNVSQHRLIEVPGNDHIYDTIPELKRMTEEFIDL